MDEGKVLPQILTDIGHLDFNHEGLRVLPLSASLPEGGQALEDPSEQGRGLLRLLVL